MDSCTACRNLEPLPGLSGGFITGGVGQDLQHSASSCLLCSILWEGLETFCLESPTTVQWIALRQDGESFRLQYKQTPNDKRWMGLHFYTTDSNDPLSEIFQFSDDLEPNTGCSKYLSQIKGWIDSCNENHALCKSRLNGQLPTRVLDVSRERGRVFLYEPNKTDRGPYVALSHCWGGAVPIMTTTENIDHFKAGIPIDAFPRTFRDAISVTQLIQCCFLWIDSLCIIQDNTEDWKNEASHMAEVYGNSYITLAATASVNSRGGLFRTYNRPDVKHSIERHARDGQPTRVNVRPSLEHTPYYESSHYGLEPSAAAPLLERSWCFQEYLLSPRVLSFTQWETLWVCTCQKLCNCGEFREDTRSLISESDLKVRFDAQLQESSPKDLRQLWQDVIKAYSLKRLTFDKDKLPALAGIAELFFKRGFGRYVNGLWEPTLLSDLFWELDWSFVSYYGIVAARSMDQSMPSWSWASVSGSFRYNTHVFEGIEVLDILYDPAVSRPLAETCARAITIRGVLTRASAWGATDFENSPSNHQRQIQVVGAPEHSWYVDIASELSCDANTPTDVYIICGTRGPGIVLRRIKETTSTYRRLGIIERYPPTRDEKESNTIQLI